MQRYLQSLPIDVFIYPGQPDPFVPEHENPEEMREWLRSEPSSLPFSEVWEDLRQLLARKASFATMVQGRPFKAEVSEDPRGLRITASGQPYFMTYESLLAFWQQLRTHGFSMRQIAPELSREVSYLVPIFAELPYVKPVRVARDYASLQRSPVTGLQVLPALFGRSHRVSQLPLFELS